jgi:glutathione synthase/RimK-type ligase-like ATP-grasp enzyme
LAQEFLRHAVEYRVYALRSAKGYAISIRNRSGDFRSPHNTIDENAIEVSETTPPGEIESAIQLFLEHAKLDYGAFDFVYDIDNGSWVFLEVNSSGGWRCYERILRNRVITDRYCDYILRCLHPAQTLGGPQ